MDPSLAIASLCALGVGSGALGWRFGPRAARVWAARRCLDPNHDPGAARATEAHRRTLAAFVDHHHPGDLQAAWDLALAEDGGAPALRAAATFRHHATPSGLVVVGLTLFHLDGHPWREALRQLPPLEPDSDDEGAIEAERCLALGQGEQARRWLARVPADHWRACRVRAVLYALEGDDERAESARHAAWALAPGPARSALDPARVPHPMALRS